MSTSWPSRWRAASACVNLAMVRGGRHLGDRPYFPAHVEDAAGMEAARTGRRRKVVVSTRGGAGAGGLFGAALYLDVPVPPSLVTSEPVRKRLVQGTVEQAACKVRAVHQPREQRRIWLEMAQTNAACNWRACWPKRGRSRPARGRWPRRWTWRWRPRCTLRVECFDISHTAGEATQASCVVFHHHKMQNSRVPALQHRGHHARRRLRGHAPGADAPLQQGGGAP
jgi:excinuclease ABC subunit C